MDERDRGVGWGMSIGVRTGFGKCDKVWGGRVRGKGVI